MFGYLTHVLDQTGRSLSYISTYRRHEQEKKRQYDLRIRSRALNVHTTGSINHWRMGRTATTFYKSYAEQEKEMCLQQNDWMDMQLQSTESFSHVH